MYGTADLVLLLNIIQTILSSIFVRFCVAVGMKYYVVHRCHHVHTNFELILLSTFEENQLYHYFTTCYF